MTRNLSKGRVVQALTLVVALWPLPLNTYAQAAAGNLLGREVAIPRHMQNGEEFQTPIPQLIEYGRALFTASWTIQEGAGRPSTKGTGAPLSDATQPYSRERSIAYPAPTRTRAPGATINPMPAAAATSSPMSSSLASASTSRNSTTPAAFAPRVPWMNVGSEPTWKPSAIPE